MMRWRATVGVAMRMLLRRRTRSVLTMLGATLTIAALMAAVSFAERGRLRALAEIRDMGATVLTVSAQLTRNRGASARTGTEVRTLTIRDEREIAHVIAAVDGTAAEYRSTVPIKVGNLARVTTIAGVEPSYARIRGASIAAGRFFTDEEDAAGSRVAVIGAQIAADIFRSEKRELPVLGRSFRIRGILFNVIGLLPARGTGLDAFDEDNAVFVPLKTARRRLFQVDFVQRIFVHVRDDETLTPAAASILDVLRKRHRSADAQPLDFRVQDQRRLVTLRLVAARDLALFERIVATALVGASALGVFALQLLAVRERQTEIGTRRALGARRRTIFWQFVLESSLVTAMGGVLGLGCGLAVTTVSGIPSSSSVAIIGCVACVGAAIIAAAIPAWLAASLRPSVALRPG